MAADGSIQVSLAASCIADFLSLQLSSDSISSFARKYYCSGSLQFAPVSLGSILLRTQILENERMGGKGSRKLIFAQNTVKACSSGKTQTIWKM